MNRSYFVFGLEVLSDIALLFCGIVACIWAGADRSFLHHVLAPVLITSGAARLTMWTLLLTENPATH